MKNNIIKGLVFRLGRALYRGKYGRNVVRAVFGTTAGRALVARALVLVDDQSRRIQIPTLVNLVAPELQLKFAVRVERRV